MDRIVCDDALSVPEVNLFVELPEGSAVGCPVCGAKCTSINGNEEDIWVDLSRRHGCRLVVRSRVAFAGCPNCGVRF